LFALLDGERLENILNDLPREIGREIRDLVGIELLGCGDELVLIHAGDEGLSHGIGYFQKDFAVTPGFYEIPYDQALVEWKCLEDIGDIGRMEAVEFESKLIEVAPFNELL
jgi:hypothetical protein